MVNSSLIEDKASRNDIKVHYIPANQIADEAGQPRGMNMVFLGAYVYLTGTVSLESIYSAIDYNFSGSKAKFADANKRLVQLGYEYVKSQQEKQ